MQKGWSAVARSGCWVKRRRRSGRGRCSRRGGRAALEWAGRPPTGRPGSASTRTAAGTSCRRATLTCAALSDADRPSAAGTCTACAHLKCILTSKKGSRQQLIILLVNNITHVWQQIKFTNLHNLEENSKKLQQNENNSAFKNINGNNDNKYHIN